MEEFEKHLRYGCLEPLKPRKLKIRKKGIQLETVIPREVLSAWFLEDKDYYYIEYEGNTMVVFLQQQHNKQRRIKASYSRSNGCRIITIPKTFRDQVCAVPKDTLWVSYDHKRKAILYKPLIRKSDYEKRREIVESGGRIW